MTLDSHKKHLIIAAMVVVVVPVLAWKVIAYEGGIAHDQRILAEEKLKNDLAIAKTQAQATAADTALLQQQVASLQASNNALRTTLAKLDADLANRRQQDAALPPDALAARWLALVGKGQITPQPQGLLADDVASHATVDQLERLPVVEEKLNETVANSAVKDAALKSTEKVLGDVRAELDTCHAVQKDSDAVCKAKLDEQKAKYRKRMGIIGAIGAILGYIVRGKIKI